MWPLDRTPTKEYLRVGREAIERWQEVDGALTSVAIHPMLQGAGEPMQSLSATIQGAYAGAPPVGPITLLLESVWLPAMLVDTGAALLQAVELDALVRHRFGLHHGDAREPVSGWELRIEHRAGGRQALAYGLSPQVKRALMAAGDAVDVKWAAMLPAFSWGWHRLRPTRAWSSANGWWVWPEQDRLMVARVADKRLAGLNAGAPRDDDEPGILRLIDGEAVRLGFASSVDPIAVAVWDESASLRRAGARLTWVDVRVRGAMPVQPIALSRPARMPT